MPIENNRAMEAIENILENRGNVSKAMLEAGYSEAYSKNPHQFVATKQFKELTEAYLPDDMLLRALQDDIENKPANRKAELELAFKIKGKLVDKSDIMSGGEKIVFMPPEVIKHLKPEVDDSTA